MMQVKPSLMDVDLDLTACDVLLTAGAVMPRGVDQARVRNWKLQGRCCPAWCGSRVQCGQEQKMSTKLFARNRKRAELDAFERKHGKERIRSLARHHSQPAAPISAFQF